MTSQGRWLRRSRALGSTSRTAAKSSPRRASTAASTSPRWPARGRGGGQDVEAGDAHHADAEGLGQTLGGGDAHAQSGEQSRPDVDRHDIEVRRDQADLAQQVLDGRSQGLDMAPAAGQGQLGLDPGVVRTATPTVSVAVSRPEAARSTGRGVAD